MRRRRRLFGRGEDPTTIGFIDVTMIGLVVVLAPLALSIMHINPPPKNVAEKRTPSEMTLLHVEVTWASNTPHDVDTWVECGNRLPGGGILSAVVGYRQKLDKWLGLDIDDLGAPSPRNIERVRSNSLATRVPPNTVCNLNVHLYSTHGGVLPVTGMMLAIADKDGPDERLIGEVPFTLNHAGEEVTVITSVWDENGKIKEDAVAAFPDAPVRLIATRGG